MDKVEFSPIGMIYTPFDKAEGMPIQPRGGNGESGKIEVFSGYADGLKDVESFSHIMLIYHFNRSNGFKLQVSPFLEDDIHGVFAVRAPKRPNPIGVSIVKVISRENNVIHFENPDMLNETPLLDIKPYIPDFDSYPNAVAGWCEKHRGKVATHRSDSRFNRDND
jgi:tRNA (adenine37-N6)-methyltransferase